VPCSVSGGAGGAGDPTRAPPAGPVPQGNLETSRCEGGHMTVNAPFRMLVSRCRGCGSWPTCLLGRMDSERGAPQPAVTGFSNLRACWQGLPPRRPWPIWVDTADRRRSSRCAAYSGVTVRCPPAVPQPDRRGGKRKRVGHARELVVNTEWHEGCQGRRGVCPNGWPCG
jgi:hypothetical protein